MSTKTGKLKSKQSSRGQRKHMRRMKQEARRGNVPDNKLKKVTPIVAAPKQ